MKICETVDYGQVVDVFVNGPAEISEIAPGVIRVSWWVQKDNQQVVADQQLWSTAQFAEALMLLQATLGQMRSDAMERRLQMPVMAGMH